MTDTPKFERVNGAWSVTLPGVDGAFRVAEARPPRFVVERDVDGTLERRSFFFSPDSRTRGDAWFGSDGETLHVAKPSRRGSADGGGAAGSGEIEAPMPGKVLEVLVAEGDAVETGDRLVVVEAMKMEQPLRAPHAGTVTKLHVEVGQMVGAGDPVVVVEESSSE